MESRLLVALSCVSLVIAGCGGSSNKETDTGTTTAPGQTTQESSEASPNAITELPSAAGEVVAGKEYLWIASEDGVIRFDPRGLEPVGRPVRLPHAQAAHLAVADGTVWAGITNVEDSTGSLSAIDERGGRPRGRPVPLPGTVTSVVADAKAAWVAVADGKKGSLSRHDPRTGKTTATEELPQVPGALALDGDTLWIVPSDQGPVRRLDTRSNRLSGKPIEAGAFPSAVTIGKEAVWVADGDSPEVTALDRRTGEPLGTVKTDAVPKAIASGDEGVYVLSLNSTVTKIDETAISAKPPVPLGGSSSYDIAAGLEAVWVTDTDAGISELSP